jgi:UDP-3-O-[3-hydroxymyristoyl] N-acetylglucosamine deacetylase
MSASTALPGDRARYQQTLANPVVCHGIGLHTGQATTVRLLPALVDSGRYFVRTDMADAPMIPAHVSAVGQTRLSTELVQDAASVRTIEHLLAALFGQGIDNVRIEVDGPEVPLLDGSAQDWVALIATAGIQAQSVRLQPPRLSEAIWLYQDDQFVAAVPAPTLKFSYGIEFDLSAIGQQWHSWHPVAQSFGTEIAPARTFGLAHQIEQLQQAGLIKGGSLDNALVCGADGWINPPLRFSNEPVRHKLLDLVGDLSLVGVLPIAHYLAYKASHHLHTQLAQKLVATMVNSPTTIQRGLIV